MGYRIPGFFGLQDCPLPAGYFIRRSGITSPTQVRAIQTLVFRLWDEGLWNYFLAIWPIVGGSSSSHQYNLINSSHNLTFIGSPTHNSNGIVFSGSPGVYVNTGVSGPPMSSFGINLSNINFGVNTKSLSAVSQSPMGIYKSSSPPVYDSIILDYTNSGTYSLPPGALAAGVVTVECWGGGGGGGNGFLGVPTSYGGGGGGGGAYSKEVLNLESITQLDLVISGPASPGQNGGLTNAAPSQGSIFVEAYGGNPGGDGSPGGAGSGGAGGDSSMGTGSVKFSGGNGSAGVSTSGGGAGGGAGTSENGQNGSGTSGGRGGNLNPGSGGGTGGNGGTTTGSNGFAGNEYGGGGGGGQSGSFFPSVPPGQGGEGSAGAIRISWEISPAQVFKRTSMTVLNDGRMFSDICADTDSSGRWYDGTTSLRSGTMIANRSQNTGSSSDGYFQFDSTDYGALGTVSVMSTVDVSDMPNFFIGALNNNGSPQSPVNGTINFAWIGKSLTTSQSDTFNLIIDEYNSILGR